MLANDLKDSLNCGMAKVSAGNPEITSRSLEVQT